MARKRCEVARTFLAVCLVSVAVGLTGARPSRPGLSSWILQEPFRSIAVAGHEGFLQTDRRHVTTSTQHRTPGHPSSRPAAAASQDNNNLIRPQLSDSSNNNNNNENPSSAQVTPPDYYNSPSLPLFHQLDTDDDNSGGKSSSLADLERRPEGLLPVRQKAAPGLNADVFYVSRGRRRSGGSLAPLSAPLHTGGMTSSSSRSTARRPQLAAAALLGFGGRELERLAGRGRTEFGQPETNSEAQWMLAGVDSRDQYRSLKVKRQPPPGFHAIRGKRRSHGRYQESGLPKD